MAAYPSLTILHVSTRDFDWGIQMDVSTSGKASTRVFYTGEPSAFVIHHRLDDTDRDTLQAFCVTNKQATISITWEGSSYDCILAPPGYQERDLGNGYWDIQVHLREIGP